MKLNTIIYIILLATNILLPFTISDWYLSDLEGGTAIYFWSIILIHFLVILLLFIARKSTLIATLHFITSITAVFNFLFGIIISYLISKFVHDLSEYSYFYLTIQIPIIFLATHHANLNHKSLNQRGKHNNE